MENLRSSDEEDTISEVATDGSEYEIDITSKSKVENVCNYCGKTFTYKGNLARHVKTCANEAERNLVHRCNYCCETFSRKSNLKRHIKTCEISDQELASEEPTLRLKNKILQRNTSHSDVKNRCVYCHKTFRLKWTLIRHVRTCFHRNKEHIVSKDVSCTTVPVNNEIVVKNEESTDETTIEHNYYSETLKQEGNLTWHIEPCETTEENPVSEEATVGLNNQNPRRKRARSDVEHRCNFCHKTFQLRWKLNSHIKKCRARKKTVDLKCKCSICGVNAISTLILHDHYQSSHKIDLSEKELQFETLADFQGWKDEFEQDTTSRFIKPRAAYEIKSGIQFIKYVCHRSGSFKPKGNNVRRVKRTGSNKIGYCPARIYVYVTTENVTAKYIDTHIGHEMEVRRLLLSNLEKNKIAQKLRSNIPRQVILNEIRESVDTNNQLKRVDLLTRHDIRNIENAYLKHKNDSCAQSSSNTVEPQGETVKKYPQLALDDSCVIKAKFKMLPKFGQDYNRTAEFHDSTQTSLTDVTEQQSAVLREVSRKSDESLEDRKRGILETVITACNMANDSEQVDAIEKLIAPLLRIVKCIERSKNTSMPSKDVEAPNKKIVLYKNKRVNLKKEWLRNPTDSTLIRFPSTREK